MRVLSDVLNSHGFQASESIGCKVWACKALLTWADLCAGLVPVATPAQVLKVVTLGASAGNGGGFFPSSTSPPLLALEIFLVLFHESCVSAARQTDVRVALQTWSAT